MKKANTVVSKNSRELAEALGLNKAEAVEWELRNTITKRIMESAREKGLSAAIIAKHSGTSRGRVTKILKDDSLGISLDVLVRVLGAIGEQVKISFKKVA